MNGPRTAVAVVVCAAVVAGAAGALAHATAPGKNGQIVFTGPSPNRLWVIGPDGTGLRKLTVTKGSRLSDGEADWSPDGSKITFQRCEQLCRVWTIKPDGTGLERLGPAADDRAHPAWSPDGKAIAYTRGWGGVENDKIRFAEIFVMSAGGAGARQVTHVTTSRPFSADIEHPVWAPDGKQLVFEVHNSRLGEPAKRRALFVVNADGSDEARQLTEWSLNGSDPDWSPDGKLILFRSVPGREQHGNLYTVNPDGGGLKQLTSYPAPKAVFPGSFSPDGEWITFSRFTSSPYPGIFVMRTNGTGVRQVSSGGYNVAPDWGPAR
jgi:TolB protein